jgi:hypothetical protein
MGWRRRCDPHIYLPFAAGGAPYGPAAVDEAPVAPDPFSKPFQVDVADVEPSCFQARWTRQECAHAVVDQLAERVNQTG